MAKQPRELKKRNEMFTGGLLLCFSCNDFLPIESFYPDSQSNSNYGYRFYCRNCEYSKRKDKIAKHCRNKNRGRKKLFVDLAGGKCQRCGYSQYLSSLDFHHIYRTDKEYNPVALIYNGDYDTTWKELDKCCLLCRNCHGAYEGGEWRSEFIKRDGLGWAVGNDLPLDDDRYKTKPAVVLETPIIRIPDKCIPTGYKQPTLF